MRLDIKNLTKKYKDSKGRFQINRYYSTLRGNGTVEIDESYFDKEDGAFNGLSEQAGYTYIIEDRAFCRGVLLDSVLETGKSDCWISYDSNGGMVWD